MKNPVCDFCKKELATSEEIYYKICDKCYYGMRLDPDGWLEWLRGIGQDAVRVKIGLFVPKDQWYEGIDEDRIKILSKIVGGIE